MTSRLEQFDRVAIGILQQNLSSAGTGLHCIAESETGLFELLDPGGKILHLKNHPIPATGLLRLPVRHWAGTRRSRTAQDQLQIAARNLAKSGEVLNIQMETELVDIEIGGTSDIADLVSDAPKAADEVRLILSAGL